MAIFHLYSMIFHRIRHWNKGSLGSFVKFIWILQIIRYQILALWRDLSSYTFISPLGMLYFLFISFSAFLLVSSPSFISSSCVSPLSSFLYFFVFPPSSFFFFHSLYHLVCSLFSFCILHGIPFLSLFSQFPFSKFSFSFFFSYKARLQEDNRVWWISASFTVVPFHWQILPKRVNADNHICT